MRILLVEDEKKVSSFIKKGLEEEFYSVDTAYDGKSALNFANNENYDLIILDIMLPVKDGVTVLREMRKNEISVPVLMLTAKDSTDNKIEGLDSGADDYLTKPFAFEELLARVRALLRRNSVNRSVLLKAADMTLDAQTHKVKRGAIEILLTPKEYSILEYLMRNKNRIISRTVLTEHVYDYHFDTDTNVIDVYMNKLRNKIDKAFEKQLLHTVRGAGYMIKDE
jgi:DNA-binding response OmpR family regulator